MVDKNLIISAKIATKFCTICDFKSLSMKRLGVHMWRKHGTIEQLDGNGEKNSSICDICDFKSLHADFMKRHIRKYHELED